MKKLVLFLYLTIFSLNMYSQDAIKFLGIPVDGTKSAMGAKLKAKGFVYSSKLGGYTGEFNGTKVVVSIQTVNNKVWRLAITDVVGSNEADIKIRFNSLIDQFSYNGKYYPIVGGNVKIPEGEDISYGLFMNERYQATFAPVKNTSEGRVWYMIGGQYGDYRIIMFYENLNNAAKGDDL